MSAEPNTHLRLVREPSPTEGRVPPHDLEAEAALLAVLMIEPTMILRVDAWLHVEHFYSEAHRRIYEAILAIAERGFKPGEEACIVRVGSELRARGRIQQVGGMAYLTQILMSMPVIDNVEKYAETVHDKWRARRVISVCQRVAAEGYLDYGDAQTYADGAIRELTDISRDSVGGDIESNLAALKRIVGLLRDALDPEKAPKRRAGILTGLQGLDYETSGLHAGQKTVIVALPGVGKTALATQIADHVASQRIGVLFFSNEMSRDELLTRILARRARVDGRRIAAATLSEREWKLITHAVNEIPYIPMLIDDTDGMTIGHVVTRMRRETERFQRTFGVPLGLVVLDWIQNLTREPQDRGLKDHEFVKRCTKAFKDTLKELKIPGIETAQQKPSEIDKVSKLRPKPGKGSVADSSWVEKLAEQVVYLHRNPVRNWQEKVVGESAESITLIMTKNRGGEEGELQIRFDGAIQNFECIDPSFKRVEE